MGTSGFPEEVQSSPKASAEGAEKQNKILATALANAMDQTKCRCTRRPPEGNLQVLPLAAENGEAPKLHKQYLDCKASPPPFSAMPCGGPGQNGQPRTEHLGHPRSGNCG